MSYSYSASEVAKEYEANLDLPFVQSIRKQESAIIGKLFKDTFRTSDSVIEIGAGTGYYTKDISKRVRSVIALEPSEAMASELAKKNLKNVSIINEDFLNFSSNQRFDHVVAIGVLDYISDWQTFIDKCMRLGLKSVIVTAPQKGLWGNIYKFISNFADIKIYTRTTKEMSDYMGLSKSDIYTAGFNSAITKGMTVIIKATPNSQISEACLAELEHLK